MISYINTINTRFSNWALQMTTGALDRLAALQKDNEGQDLMEYAIIGGMIAALVAGVVWLFGAKLVQIWINMTNALR